MKKITEIKRKIIRYFCTGICLTSAAFVFQASYGPMPDDSKQVFIRGKVTNASTDMPVSNVRIWLKSANAQFQFETFTNVSGYYEFHTYKQDAYNLSFESQDSGIQPKDTVISFSGSQKELNIRLDAR